MKPSIYRRIRRRSTREAVSFKKDHQPEPSFFGDAVHEPFFKPATNSPQQATMNRKCTECEKEDKVHRVPEKKEEEKVHRAADKKEEEKVQKKEEKKEEEKLMKKDEQKEEEKVQKKEGSTGSSSGVTTVSSYINSINGKGQSMSGGIRSFYESRIGADFSDVKIHTGKEAAESANAIHAQAFAFGNHIVLNEGKYQPETSEGKHLLAHELAHVHQQKGFKKINRKKDKKVNRGKFIKENCIGVDVDQAKADCNFDPYQEKVVRASKSYAIKKCNDSIYALTIPGNLHAYDIIDLVFHLARNQKKPLRFFTDSIKAVRDQLIQTPILCKSCFDEGCNRGFIAYAPVDDTFLGLCPKFFSNITDTPRYLLHEAAHLANVDIASKFRGRDEFYCTMDDKFNYWENPCPDGIDNINNADAWSYFIDRLSITV